MMRTKYVKKTRKPFLCSVCLQRIPAGGSKCVKVMVDSREIYNWQECPPCQLLVQEYCLEYPLNDWFTSDDIYDYATDRWGSMDEAKAAVMSEVPDNA